MELVEVAAVLLLSCIASIAIAAIIIFGLINPLLSDASRYGIDEVGNAKTPEYMAQKKAREEWYEVFNRLDPD